MAQEKRKVVTKWGTTEKGYPYQIPVIASRNGDLSKQWYVYYRYWHPQKKVLVKARKSRILGHLDPNRSNNSNDRYYQLQIIRNAIEDLLIHDWNPIDNKCESMEKVNRRAQSKVSSHNSPNILEALDKSLQAKKTEVSSKYFKMLTWRIGNFKEFLTEQNIAHLPTSEFSRKYILSYLTHVQNTRGTKGEKASNKTRNGYLGDLSSVFNTMVVHELIIKNPCIGIKKLHEHTGRHIPFTPTDIKKLGEWSKKNSPFLFRYTQLIAYAFLRPNEILDLQIRDIDLDSKLIKLRKESAKVDAVTIPIIEPLYNTLVEMIPQETPGHYYLLSLNEVPGSQKILQTRYFSRRFNKWKDYMNEKHDANFTDDHTLYGIRHTFIQNIFNELQKTMTKAEAEFKLMTITRHRTIDALRKYTRDYGLDLAEDWTDKFNLTL